MACMFRGETCYTWYCAMILMGCYAVGELGHFLIGIVSKPITQDLNFGDQGCIVNATSASYEDQLYCSSRNSTICSDIPENITTSCEWNYLGSGVLYQLLAGPAFIAIFSVMGIVLGIIGDIYNRVRVLTVAVIGYSLMITLTGMSQQYWQLFLLRFGFGAGEAACTPLTASIVADMFGKRSRGLAMSVFNWGIYVGYGLAFTVGNYVTQANILNQGWRWAYFLTGIPGFLMATLLLFTVKEPARKEILVDSERQSSSLDFVPANGHGDGLTVKESKSKILHSNGKEKLISVEKSLSSGDFSPLVRNDKKEMEDEIDERESVKKSPNDSGFRKLILAIKTLARNPVVWFLLLGACIRHTASFCWSYNAQLYFNFYYPGYDISIYMMLCSIIGGSVGIASGGVISDLLVSKYGVSTRLWVLVVSQALASPLAAMVLYLPPPYCFITLGSAYLFAEMWFGILFTVMVEIFPLHLRSTSIALFIFVMNNVASCAQLLVPTLKPVLGFRSTLFLTYSGFYGLCSVFFFFAQLLVRRRQRIESDESSLELKDFKG